MAPGHAVKKRRISFSDDTRGKKSNRSNKAQVEQFYANAAEWDLEAAYERRARKSKKDKERTRLPIKTAEGAVEHVEEPENGREEEEGEDSDNPFATSDEEEQEPVKEVKKTVSTLPPKVQILQAKEELARISSLILEDPEEHIELLKRLTEIVKDTSLAIVKKLALGTQAAVYKDIIPGYRIRPLKEEEMTTKVSKDVRQLRAFEQTLVSSYRAYIEHLTMFSKTKKHGGDEGLKSVAVKCACSMLVAVPHFNFRSELLRILIAQLGRRRVDEDFIKARDTLEEIFSNDDEGVVSMEAVSLLSKMMKARSYKVHPTVLDTLLHLRLLSEFSSKGSKDSIDKQGEDEGFNGKKPKQKREFRTKKQRKLLKEQKAVEKDLKEADALVGHEQRERMQAETLKAVFSTYFRILKLRTHRLVGAVLEGLARFAHLINQDFFGDLLEVLRELIELPTTTDTPNSDSEDEDEEESDQTTIARNATREALLCSTTAFALLAGQDASKAASTLHLDLSFFITHLYQTLYPLGMNPDVEFNPNKSLRLPDPSTTSTDSSKPLPTPKKKIDFQTPTVLLLRCLNAILLTRGPSTAPPQRVAAFTKRLMTTSLQTPEKSSLAILSLLNRVAKQHGRRIAPLWNTDERRGDGEFNPLSAGVEGSNVFAGNVWEGELLRVHYCPEVREAARGVEGVIAGVK